MTDIITKSVLLFFVIFSVTAQSSAQLLPDSTNKKIDTLFTKWNSHTTPGCAVGIIRNDSLIFAKGYGMANLEEERAITPQTLFRIGSISKQFTAYCIILLARQGKIKLDETIHFYLPWIPDFGKKITVRNLLNHTSGIRDDVVARNIAGLNGYGVLTDEGVVRIIKAQTVLNFDPGTQYAYSNSNYVLLAELVKAVSGKRLDVFADSAIFQPLKMTHSFFIDDYRDLVKGKALSYMLKDSVHYVSWLPTLYNQGAGGIYTTIEDMAKWIVNFYNPKAGDANDLEQLTQKGKLTNGKEIGYASGIEVGMYRGWRRFSHDGQVAGYFTIASVFPDLKMGFIVFGNNGEATTYHKVDEIANLFIADKTQEKITDRSKIIGDKNNSSININYSRRIAGNYISNKAELAKIYVKEGRLYIDAYGETDILNQEVKDTFYPAHYPSIKLTFSLGSKIDNTILLMNNSNIESRFIKYNPQKITEIEVKQYSGSYYCPELETAYTILVKNGQLYLTGIKYQDTPLIPIMKDYLISQFDGLNLLKFARNKQNRITGFEADGPRSLHLKFTKIK